MFNLFKHELFSRWAAILSWGIGLALFSSLYIVIYPEVADEMASLANLSIYRLLGFDIGSFAGFIASVSVQIMPIILGIYVIMLSTGTLAGEEDNGTLELILAMPIPRWQVMAMKTLALSVVLLLIVTIMSFGSSIALIVIAQQVELDVTAWQLFVAMMGSYPMLIAFFAMGLFFGAFMPTRRLAIVVIVVIYIGSYLLNSVAGMVDSLSWVERFSLFTYVDTTATVFENGIDPGNVLILLVVAAIFFGLALWSFQGRNITVGQWVWERQQQPQS